MQSIKEKFIKQADTPLIKVRIIDENGLFVRDDTVAKLTDYTIETPCPDGFILPKWDGTQWVEGGTAPQSETPAPTQEERLKALEDAVIVLMGGNT